MIEKRKLYKYGIRGNVWHLIKSYLYNRSEYVSYNTQNSSTKGIQCGVPQGSILGPLFFIIYINDLSNVSQKIFSILFADDTNIFIQGNNLPQLIHDLQTELSTLVDWLNTNKLTINPGASPGFGMGGPRILFFRFGNLHVAKRHAAHGEAMRFARGVRGNAPPRNFFKIVQFGAFWCIF